MRRGVINAVVTTNFDTLIEQALIDEKVKFEVYSRSRDYERRGRTRCSVLEEIHGSAIPDSPLIDTVGQKLRGLAPVVRERLRALFAQHPVLVLGYSGGDLEFGSDYLTLQSVPPGRARLWWVVRPEDIDKVEGPARDIVANRGVFIRMSQAQALEGVPGPVNAEWNTETRAVRLNDVRLRARTLFAKLGSINTLAFCMRLLSSAGRSSAAASMWTHIASVVDKRKRQTVPVLGPAMRALASEGHRLFGVDTQEAWACRQLRDIHRRREGRTANYRDEDALIRDVRSEALACLAIGDSKVRRGEDEAAGLAMGQAMKACEYIGDITLLPGVYRLYGWRDVVRLRQRLKVSLPLHTASDAMVADLVRLEQRGLMYLMAAEAAGLVGGNVDAIESAWIRADLLVDLGEYDAALLCLERLQERVGLGVHRETRVRIECVRGNRNPPGAAGPRDEPMDQVPRRTGARQPDAGGARSARHRWPDRPRARVAGNSATDLRRRPCEDKGIVMPATAARISSPPAAISKRCGRTWRHSARPRFLPASSRRLTNSRHRKSTSLAGALCPRRLDRVRVRGRC